MKSARERRLTRAGAATVIQAKGMRRQLRLKPAALDPSETGSFNPVVSPAGLSFNQEQKMLMNIELVYCAV